MAHETDKEDTIDPAAPFIGYMSLVLLAVMAVFVAVIFIGAGHA